MEFLFLVPSTRRLVPQPASQSTAALRCPQVATQRLDQPDAAVPGATPAEGSAPRAEEGSPSREFVAQKWMTDEAQQQDPRGGRGGRRN